MAKLLAQTNLPAGAFNLVTGQGKLVGDAFLAHPNVKMITFTGSPAVGISLRNRAGLKKVTLELGSNAGVIIDEGVQLERIMDRIVMGAFSTKVKSVFFTTYLCHGKYGGGILIRLKEK